DLTMTAKRCGGREDYVVADHTIVADMGIVHEVSAFADAGDATAFDGPDVHGHALADRAASADFKAGRLAPKAESLRRPPAAGKRRNHAIGADQGVSHHVDMGDQLAVFTDNDVRSDDAVRTDQRALTNYGAVLNPRGWIDHAHRMVRGP